jgi:hypothetical protein
MCEREIGNVMSWQEYKLHEALFMDVPHGLSFD